MNLRSRTFISSSTCEEFQQQIPGPIHERNKRSIISDNSRNSALPYKFSLCIRVIKKIYLTRPRIYRKDFQSYRISSKIIFLAAATKTPSKMWLLGCQVSLLIGSMYTLGHNSVAHIATHFFKYENPTERAVLAAIK